MTNLCIDIGYSSMNKFGEELCGDHVEIVEPDCKTSICVLADGLGSGVKANILSILTSKIVSTMLSSGMSIEDAISTMMSTLPVCDVRKIAYSTFTVIRVNNNQEAEIIQYDNPQVVLLRNGANFEYPMTEMNIDGKKIFKSTISLELNDCFICVSDGCIYAGVGKTMNFGWQRESIIEYLEERYNKDYSAKTMATILLDKCNQLYANEPGDDTTVVALRVRERKQINLLIGPPSKKEDDNKMLTLFFSKAGEHIVCGGTTAQIVAKYLNKTINLSIDNLDEEVPPMAEIEGVDLVTEGIITMSKVLEYSKNFLEKNEKYIEWSYKSDGASNMARMLFEEATDIDFFVGRAMNPAHQNPDLPINFNIKMQLVDDLAANLKKMGKKIKVSYF